jgi:hopene-associated glycosyltransferase HpnB
MLVALLTFCAWVYLCLAHGNFWRSSPELRAAAPAHLPDVDIVIPARDEAQTIGPVIASLLRQDYAGRFQVILVDDASTDGTAAAAGTAPNLIVIGAEPKPDGWSGKLWALRQGVARGSAPLFLFADADIVHDPRHLSALVARLELPHAEMVSEMVRLNCTSLAERALIPAFVYFFQMLYPFAKVNDPRSRVAAAAGGTVLIRRQTLDRIGGIDAIKGALIDDVALAKAVKTLGPIYLGHSGLAASIRAYPDFSAIRQMISRTAFTQLRHSALLLVLTLVGLSVVWIAPVWEIAFGRGWAFGLGLGAFLLATASYLPTLARYRQNPLWSLALPLIALFYMAATLGSALNHWLGRGTLWKDRAYRTGT